MNFEELITKLEAEGGNEDLIKSLKESQGEVKKKNSENQGLRNRAKKAEEDKAKLAAKLKKLSEYSGIETDLPDDEAELEEALEALKEAKEAAKAGGAKNTSPEVAALTSKIKETDRALKKLQEENNTYKTLAAQEKSKRIDMMRDSVLQEALAEGKAVKPSQLSKLLKDNIKIADDGSESFVFTADDGNELTVKEGVKSFLEANPEFVMNSSNPGAGSGANGKNIDVENMTQEQYKKWRATQK
ncbi:MAG: hypothetical protein H6Q70_511 [Firmicutes bacterium]|nr:hypothetical protein [Bacillota bacterium]